MTTRVEMTAAAKTEFTSLPATIKARVLGIFVRLQGWPEVSGAKPMSGDLSGSFRVRTGDYRIIFHVTTDAVVVTRIGHRRDVYEG